MAADLTGKSIVFGNVCMLRTCVNDGNLSGESLAHYVAADIPAKSIVLSNVRKLRTTKTMDIYLVSLLPSTPKSPIQKTKTKTPVQSSHTKYLSLIVSIPWQSLPPLPPPHKKREKSPKGCEPSY